MKTHISKRNLRSYPNKKSFALLFVAFMVVTILLLGSAQAALANAPHSGLLVPPATPNCNASPAPEVNWDDCDITKIIKTNLNSTNLQDSLMKRTNLSGVSMVGAKLMRVNFSNANLSRANLNNVDMTDAILSGANLKGASLTGAALRSTNIEGGFIFDSSTKLNNVDLSGADLSGADLTGIDFGGVNLTGADLSSTILTDVITDGKTDFSGANLTDAVGLTATTLGTFDNVTCPNGTVISAGQTCFAPTAIRMHSGSASQANDLPAWLPALGLALFAPAAWVTSRRRLGL